MSLAKKTRFKKKKKKDLHRRSDGMYGISIQRQRKLSKLETTEKKQRFFAPGSDLTYSESNPNDFTSDFNSPLSPLSPISPITPKTPKTLTKSRTSHMTINEYNTQLDKLNKFNKKNKQIGSKVILRPKRNNSTPNTLLCQQNKKNNNIINKKDNNLVKKNKTRNIVKERAKLFEKNNKNDGKNGKLSPKSSVSYFDLINPFASVSKKKRKLRRGQSELNLNGFDMNLKKKNDKLLQKYDYNNNIKSSMNGNVIYISSQSNIDDNANAVKIINQNINNDCCNDDSSSSDNLDETNEGVIKNKNNKKKSKINIWNASINYLNKKNKKNNSTKNEKQKNLSIPISKKKNQLSPSIIPSPKPVNYAKIFRKDSQKLKERRIFKKKHDLKHQNKHLTNSNKKHKHFYPTTNNDSLKLVSVKPIINDNINDNKLTLKNINAMNGYGNDNINHERRESFSFDSSVAHSIILQDSNENKNNLLNIRPNSRRSRASSFSSIGGNSVAPSVILVDKSVRYRRHSFDTMKGSSDEDDIEISEEDALMFDINEEIILAQMNKKKSNKIKPKQKKRKIKQKTNKSKSMLAKRVSFV